MKRVHHCVALTFPLFPVNLVSSTPLSLCIMVVGELSLVVVVVVGILAVVVDELAVVVVVSVVEEFTLDVFTGVVVDEEFTLNVSQKINTNPSNHVDLLHSVFKLLSMRLLDIIGGLKSRKLKFGKSGNLGITIVLIRSWMIN